VGNRSLVAHADASNTLLQVQPSTLTEAFRRVRETHGGFNDAYWESMGVARELLDALRGELLEPARTRSRRLASKQPHDWSFIG
jgi:hypothetical protein